jgi:Uma2 family endonuclease
MIAKIPGRFTIDDVNALAEANPGWKIERDADGTVSLSPTGGNAGACEARLGALLSAWNGDPPRGVVFSSSTGFVMPDRALLSPDASWISRERWEALTEQERRGYPPIVPDLCVEVRSPSDAPSALREKLLRYRAYGATFVVLVDPEEQSIWTDGTAPDDFSIDPAAVFA